MALHSSTKQLPGLKEGLCAALSLFFASRPDTQEVFSGMHNGLGNLAATVRPLPQPCLDSKPPRVFNIAPNCGSLALVEHWGGASVRAVVRVGAGVLKQGVSVAEGL